MATKKEGNVRLFCIENNLALLVDDEIVGFLSVEPYKIKEEIELQIQNGNRRPTKIFQSAIQEITNVEFILKCETLGLSIHDSKYYKNYLEFIKASLHIEKQHKRDLEERQAKRAYNKKNMDYTNHIADMNDYYKRRKRR